MLTSKEVKEFAKAAGADKVGIASMDRFEGVPKQMDARYIFPGTELMIVLGFRIARGTLRAIEEGTKFGKRLQGNNILTHGFIATHHLGNSGNR